MKFTKYFIALAAVFGMASCSMKEEMAMLPSAEDVVAPVLEDLDGPISITPTNMGLEKVTFSWTPADYGVATEVNYSIEAETADAKVVVVSGITDTTTVSTHISETVTYDALNQILFNQLGLESGVEAEVAFSVSAKIGNSAKVYSNAIKVLCTVTAAEKVYPMVYVIGDFNGWSDGTTQELFDFEGTDAKYSGMIGFDGKAANGFKVRGSEIGWDNTLGNWGLDGGKDAPEAESASISLLNDGGSSDIKIYSKNFYNMTLTKADPSLSMNFSFNSIGVIGTAVGGWDSDIDFNFNTTTQRFYVDVTLVAGEMKFRVDDDWAMSWGVAESKKGVEMEGGVLDGGENITVPAGNYRIYLNFNNPSELTFELNAAKYLQPEGSEGDNTPETPDTPTPPVMTGWGIVGSITNWGNLTADNTYIPDVALTSDGTWYAAKAVEIPAGAEIKFRKDGAWATQWGLGADAFAANAEMTLSSDGGSGNIVPAAGTYDIYLNPETGKAWFITDGSYPGGGAAPEASEWGVVGDVNNWGGSPDIVMYKTATEDLFVAYNAQISAGGIKIRANNEWNDAKNYGLPSAGSVEVDHAYDLICGSGSQNMTIAAGSYDIWFDLKNSKVYIMTPGKPITEAEGGSAVAPDPSDNVWGIVGDVNGWNAPDITLEASATEGLFVAYKVTMPAGKFKIRANGQWNDAANYGLATAGTVEVDHVYDLVCSGGSGDMTLAAGTYDIWFDLKNSKVYIMTPDKPITEAK